jgi:hypothetical protein
LQPFFYKKSEPTGLVPENSLQDEPKYNIDPLLGWAMPEEMLPDDLPHSKLIDGFLVHERNFGSEPIIIATLGGSTTEGMFLNGNWPFQLSELLAERKISYKILNAGVGGYSSYQEVLRLIRDILPNKRLNWPLYNQNSIVYSTNGSSRT